MLTNVTDAVNRMARNVVVNHPNTFNCQVYRKIVTRIDSGTMGGAPTLGGLGVLSNEDEEAIEYQWIGNGYACQAESFQPAILVDRQDANELAGTEFRFLIEPEAPSGHEDWFDVRPRDVFYLLLGTGDAPPKLAFEVVNIETTLNIPPYTNRYIANRRDDLHVPAGGE